jgi:Fic family protein
MSQPNWIDRHLQQRLEQKRAQIKRLPALPKLVLEGLSKSLLLEQTYHSNAIDGNSLSLRETEIVVVHGMTSGSHRLSDYLEARNQAATLERLQQLASEKAPITLSLISYLHRQLMSDSSAMAGQWRRTASERALAPSPDELPKLLEEWVGWINRPHPNYHPVLLVSIAHHAFLALQPFEEANGRVGRMLLNLMLLRAGYPQALLLYEWRSAYHTALEKAEGGDYLALTNLIGRAVEQVLDRYLKAYRLQQGDDQELLLAELAQQTGESAAYLALLIRKGRLEGHMRGGRWYSTAGAVSRYRAAVAQRSVARGRPPKKRVS